MSAQLADEVNTLAGQIHAIASGSANKMTTLERRKRQAPKPPQSSTKERDKSVVKRKAPSPPITRAPPQFVVPPPPKDPPPTTPSFSPVGPLSPKSIGRWSCHCFTLRGGSRIFFREHQINFETFIKILCHVTLFQNKFVR